MKKISVLIPCFNEVENVEPISEAIVNEITTKLPQYDYEVVFIDNFSIDGTRDKLEEICSNKKIKVFLMPRTLVSLTHLFMGCARLPEIALFVCVLIFRIQLI